MHKISYYVDFPTQRPYDDLRIENVLGDTNWDMSLDYLIKHFHGFDSSTVYNSQWMPHRPQHELKFVLQFQQMPARVNVVLLPSTLERLHTDPNCYLLILNMLESRQDERAFSEHCAQKNIPLDKVIVLTSNKLSHLQCMHGIQYVYVDYWESLNRQHCRFLRDVRLLYPQDRQQTIHTASKHYISLNRNIKPHRIWWMYALHQTGAEQRGHVSYHLPDVDTQHHSDLSTHELVLRQIPEQRRSQYLAHCEQALYSRHLDTLSNHPVNHVSDIVDYYKDSLVSYVTESDTEYDFITEKTYKAIANCHPFFIVGNPEQHATLRSKGYYTFEDLFEQDAITNLEQAEQACAWINRTPIEQLRERIAQDYLYKLEHNFWNYFDSVNSWNAIVEDILFCVKKVQKTG